MIKSWTSRDLKKLRKVFRVLEFYSARVSMKRQDNGVYTITWYLKGGDPRGFCVYLGGVKRISKLLTMIRIYKGLIPKKKRSWANVGYVMERIYNAKDK